MPGRQRRAVQVGKLVGMELDRQAMARGGLEHPGGLLGAESDALAKGVDRIGQALLRHAGQHFVAQQRDIAIGIACKFGGRAWAPRNVVRIETARAVPSARARSMRISLVPSRP
jgi:hypothetical protein